MREGMSKSDPEVKCYECGKIAPASFFINHQCKRAKKYYGRTYGGCMRECYRNECKFHENEAPFCIMTECIETLIKKIGDDDPVILNELAEIILIYRENKNFLSRTEITSMLPKVKTIHTTEKDIKTMNKAIRDKVKK